MMITCAKGSDAIGGLMKALDESGNSELVSELRTWVKEDFSVEADCNLNNYPISVKSLAKQSSKEDSTAVRPTFFEQAPPSDDLSKLASFKCQHRSTAEATSLVQFDKKRMMACSADGTLNMWNWRGGEEEPVIIAAKVKNVTCFQYDEEILVTGTADGTVHLFDARRLEEKWSVRLGEPVISLKFVESTLVVITENGDSDGVWWIDISRPDMQLLNHRFLYDWRGPQNLIPGVCVCPDTTFVYYNESVNIHDTKSGAQMKDDDDDECYLTAPALISTLTVGDLIATKRVVVAGCIDGKIAMWNTSEFAADQGPVKTFQRHTKRVVSLCALNGHLLSLDATGELLMWSGYDLENKNMSKPIPRVLSANGFPNVASLFAYERWFATSSSKDGIINIWSVPDLWLRSG